MKALTQTAGSKTYPLAEKGKVSMIHISWPCMTYHNLMVLKYYRVNMDNFVQNINPFGKT